MLPKFRDFEIGMIRIPQPTQEPTSELATILQALDQLHPPPPLKIPPKVSFFHFDSISVYERNFNFTDDPFYINIRNFIASIFRILRYKYLPFSLCRRNIKAPVHLVYSI